MKLSIAAIQGLLLFLLSGCKTENFGSGISASDRLKWYLTFVPPSLKIENFYESPSPAMDHIYLWEIVSTNDEVWDKFEAQLTSKPTNRDDLGVDTGIMADDFPKWWRNQSLSLIHI